MKDVVDPFIALKLLPSYDLLGEENLFWSPDHAPLLYGLQGPGEQDKYALMCLYDFSDWEQ